MQFIEQLTHIFQQNSNAAEAERMQTYMKDRFVFYGIKAPIRKQLLKETLLNHEDEVKENITAITTDLYSLQEREFHYCALDVYFKFRKKQFELSDIDTIQQLITTHSWWDTVDFIAKWILGSYLLKFPTEKYKIINSFSETKNMWLNRSAILFQLGYKEKSDASILFKQCRKHSSSKEFFIQKAIGWALREYGKTCSKEVIDFVNSTTLKPLSQREALKHLS